jgi:anti-anti-sigma regulatory factor
MAGMLRVHRLANGAVVFVLSGRIDTENITDLENLLRSEGESCLMVLDLKDVTLVNTDAVDFLSRCETGGIALKNCPAFIREWISRQREQK